MHSSGRASCSEDLKKGECFHDPKEKHTQVFFFFEADPCCEQSKDDSLVLDECLGRDEGKKLSTVLIDGTQLLCDCLAFGVYVGDPKERKTHH